MNRETRIFIWGLILLFTCGIATAIHISDIINGDHLTYVLLPFTLIGVFIGSIRLYESLK